VKTRGHWVSQAEGVGEPSEVAGADTAPRTGSQPRLGWC
jgi:hypothetical protein